ncbi:MAG: thrombospondin type 3 repeat-containing protein [Phaeodactylibacter sp.]|nr:thrombospondin type 3 repeat-containing protein [Phaeodactylibacter sp.]
MKNLFLFTLLFLFANLVGAQATYTTIANGQWDNAATWDANGVPPEPIPAGSTVNINNSVGTFNVSTITNNGTININGTGGVTLQGSTQAVNNGSVISTSTTFGSALGVSTGTSFTNNDYYQADGTGTQSSSIRMLGGTFTNANGGTLDLSGALVSFQSNNTLFFNEEGGTVDISGNTQFNILTSTGFVPDPTAVVWINAGTFNINGPTFSQLYLLGGTKNNLSTGVINVYDGTLTIGNTLNNEGAINFLASTARGQIFGTVNSATGTIDMTDGSINASGTVTIPTLTNNAILIPSSPDRTFDITGNYGGGGTLRSIIIGTAPDQYGSIVATGTADLTAQTLSVFYSGFTPAIGDAFTVAEAAGGVTGPFLSTQLPGLPSDRQWQITYTSTTAVLRVVPAGSPQDGDGDGVADFEDNCPTVFNPGQADLDNDGLGDACDSDRDGDGVDNNNDAFPDDPTETSDNDSDGVGDNADPDDDNDAQSDADELACGSDPLDAASLSADNDGDDSPDCVDPDDDNDGVADASDNCPTDANPGQEDFDFDGIGDACDPEVCFNFVAGALQDYVDGLSISSAYKRAINRRLSLAVPKFCNYNQVSSVVADLQYVVSYVSYQSGGGIPAGNADYIIAQVNGLIDALNNGTAVCCPPPVPRPANPGVATTAGTLQLQASPNPFRDEVSIRFSLPQAGPATLEVFNLSGQRVAALHAGYLDAGYQDFQWNGADGSGRQLSSGIYLVRLQTEEGMLTQKVSLVR